MEHDNAILKIVKVESGKKINWMLNVLKIILDSWYGIRNKHVGRQLSGEREGGACSKGTQIRLETRPVLFNKTKVNTTWKKSIDIGNLRIVWDETRHRFRVGESKEESEGEELPEKSAKNM